LESVHLTYVIGRIVGFRNEGAETETKELKKRV